MYKVTNIKKETIKKEDKEEIKNLIKETKTKKKKSKKEELEIERTNSHLTE